MAVACAWDALARARKQTAKRVKKIVLTGRVSETDLLSQLYLGVAIFDPTRRPEPNPTRKFRVRVKNFGFGSGSGWVVLIFSLYFSGSGKSGRVRVGSGLSFFGLVGFRVGFGLSFLNVNNFGFGSGPDPNLKLPPLIRRVAPN